MEKIKFQKPNIATALGVTIFLLLAAMGAAGYFYYQYRQEKKNSASLMTLEEADKVAEAVAKLIELPQDEKPTLATVTDKEKLSGQPFFQKAENGDKVLIYANSGRAILYRPSTDKIVDVTTVNANASKPAENNETPAESVQPAEAANQNANPSPTTDNAASSETETKTATANDAPVNQPATIALYNGSTTIGVTNKIEDKIVAAFPDAEVVAKEKAAKNDYAGLLVIDLSGKNTELAKNIADTLGGTVGTLPANEISPAADILVIVGNKQ